jgi:hypothetical protein
MSSNVDYHSEYRDLSSRKYEVQHMINHLPKHVGKTIELAVKERERELEEGVGKLNQLHALGYI